MTIQDELRKAKGSEILPGVLIGMKNVEVWMLEAADVIDTLEEKIWGLKAALSDYQYYDRDNQVKIKQLQTALINIRDGFDGRGSGRVICYDCLDKHIIATDGLKENENG